MRPTSRLVFSLAAALIATACGGIADSAEGGIEFGSSSEALVQRDTGRVIVRFKDGTTAAAKASAHAARSAKKIRTLRGGAEVVSVGVGKTEAQAKAYRARADVLWAEVDALVSPSHTETLSSNDPLAGNQWQTNAIQAPAAWSLSTGSSSVLIAICDTGVSTTHPDLAGALRMDLCFNTANGSAGDCGPVANHGTAVAGSAAAIGNNALGIAGVAWTAQIAPVRVSNLMNGSAYISDMAECIRYSSDVGAQIINLSYQSYSGGTIFQSLLDAATYAESKGALTVVAAGNESSNAVTTQDPENILFVGATTSSSAKASFSNFGKYVDVAAPGQSIYTTNVGVTCSDANADGVADPGSCTVTSNGYTSISGTSFSAPITAGAAAVLKALNPQATPAELRRALMSTAVDLGAVGEDADFGAGLINLHAAAHAIGTPVANTAPLLTLVSPASGALTLAAGATATLSATAADAEDGDLTAKVVWVGPAGTAVATGGALSVTFNASGTFTYTATVSDRFGASATAAPVTVTVTAAAPLAAPTALTATGLSNRRTALAWTDNATTETGYRVERASVKNGAIGAWASRAVLGANATSYTDAAAKGTFAYRVVAYTATQTAASNVVQITFR
jgi:thermitase